MFNQDETNIQYILNIGQNSVASPFLTTTNYAVGDYCSRNGKVYRCKTATSGAWVSSRWTEVVIGDELAKGNNIPVYTGEISASASSGTWTSVMNISLTPGLWLIEYGVSFQSNSTGYRVMALLPTSTAPEQQDRTMPAAQAVTGSATTIIKTTFINVETTTTYYIWAYQNSGSSINAYPYVRTYRMR